MVVYHYYGGSQLVHRHRWTDFDVCAFDPSWSWRDCSSSCGIASSSKFIRLNNSYHYEEWTRPTIEDGSTERVDLNSKLWDIVPIGGIVSDPIGGEVEQTHVAIQKGGGLQGI